VALLSIQLSTNTPYLTFGTGRLLHLPSAEAVSVRPDVTKGHSNWLCNVKPKIHQPLSIGDCSPVVLTYGLLLVNSCPPDQKSFRSLASKPHHRVKVADHGGEANKKEHAHRFFRSCPYHLEFSLSWYPQWLFNSFFLSPTQNFPFFNLWPSLVPHLTPAPQILWVSHWLYCALYKLLTYSGLSEAVLVACP